MTHIADVCSRIFKRACSSGCITTLALDFDIEGRVWRHGQEGRILAKLQPLCAVGIPGAPIGRGEGREVTRQIHCPSSGHLDSIYGSTATTGTEVVIHRQSIRASFAKGTKGVRRQVKRRPTKKA